MTTFSFRPSDATMLVNWNNPSIWTGGVVPNDSGADVDFPVVTYVATGNPYVSTVSIGTGESYTTHSIALRDNLSISGSLTATGDLTQYQNGQIQLNGGSISAGSLTSNVYIQGSGQITAGTFANNNSIVAGPLTINATSFSNSGTITATGSTLAVNVTAGGFAQLSAGTLTGGSYTAIQGSSATPGTLAINAGSLITTDAASITLQGGAITSHDPVSGQDVPITTSLTTIAPAGSLAIQAGNYTFGALTVSGNLALSGTSQFGSSQLTIGSGGTLQGSGLVNAPIANNGTILAQAAGGTLMLNGAVSGSGHLEIANSSGALLELNGASAQNVLFDGSAGTFRIDQPAAFTGTITPSGTGDKVILSGLSASSTTATYSGTTSGGTLTLQQSGGGTTSLHFIGNYTQSSFLVSAGPQLLSIDPPSLLVQIGPAQAPVCFVAGTRILTPEGERPVEALRVGDTIQTWSGEAKAIVWIGAGHSVVSVRDPRSRPVIVRADALGDGMPCRDLRVTEGHSLLVEGALIPVSSLINGRSILWDDRAASVSFHHIELADHDIVVADGAPAESYRDDGNRLSFSRTHGAHRRAPSPPFAPVLTNGPIVDAAWSRLAERAGGPIDGLGDDPDLHLLVGGRRVEPAAIEQGRHRFVLEDAPDMLVIASRAVVPALACTARDYRRLGIGLRRISIESDGGSVEIDHASNLLTSGCHAAEPDGTWRWTDGHAELVTRGMALSGRLVITLEVACLARYPQSMPDRAPVAVAA